LNKMGWGKAEFIIPCLATPGKSWERCPLEWGKRRKTGGDWTAAARRACHLGIGKEEKGWGVVGVLPWEGRKKKIQFKLGRRRKAFSISFACKKGGRVGKRKGGGGSRISVIKTSLQVPLEVQRKEKAAHRGEGGAFFRNWFKREPKKKEGRGYEERRKTPQKERCAASQKGIAGKRVLTGSKCIRKKESRTSG